MYEKKLKRNIIERNLFVSSMLEKKLFLNHTTLKFGGTHYGTEAKWKVPKFVLYAHQGGQYPQQYPLFFFLLWEAQQQTQLLASTPKSNSITNG
jgi:hypothetical protein